MRRRGVSMFVTAAAAAHMGLELCSCAQAKVSKDNGTLRIMAVGDSITEGYIGMDGGYRKYLQYYLKKSSYPDFDMVGRDNSLSPSTYTVTKSDNSTLSPGTVLTYDPDHAGYSGATIEAYADREGLYEILFDHTYCNANRQAGNMIEVCEPDIVLLQIGSNDVMDNRMGPIPSDGIERDIVGRLEHLVDETELYLDEGAVLFLASIPDVDAAVCYDWLENYYTEVGFYDTYQADPAGTLERLQEAVQKNIDAYNKSVRELVAKKQRAGKKIYFSDIHSAISAADGDLYDGVHPNERGYDRMGAYWAQLLTNR